MELKELTLIRAEYGDWLTSCLASLEGDSVLYKWSLHCFKWKNDVVTACHLEYGEKNVMWLKVTWTDAE